MFLGPESLQENQGSYTYSTMLCKGLEGKDIMIYMIYLKKIDCFDYYEYSVKMMLTFLIEFTGVFFFSFYFRQELSLENSSVRNWR